jgi:capsular polysaccharide transport system permease protein
MRKVAGKTDGQHKVSTAIALRRMINVMHAVILRDIRSRYFNHGLGFLIQPLMPVAHMLFLLVIYQVTGRQAVYGDDLFLFFATGLVPSLTFMYISRFMAVSIVMNKGMLAFPAVHLLDIVLARSAIEFFGMVISIAAIFVILVASGSNPYPINPSDAVIAMALTALLSIGVGIIASVISAIFPFFAMVYGLSMIVVYLSAGGPIYLHIFPEQVLYIASFNPVFQAVEWIRAAYYLGYPTQWLDKFYLVAWAFLSLLVGLLMERTLKRAILS